jgi:hypothetical protein
MIEINYISSKLMERKNIRLRYGRRDKNICASSIKFK